MRNFSERARFGVLCQPLRVQAQVARLGAKRFGEWHFVAIAPHAFEAIELARGLVEEMDDDIVVVEHHPVRMRQAFDRERCYPSSMHPLLDAARDRLHLDIGASGRDDEVVGDQIEMLDFEHHQIVGLLFQRRLCDGECLVE